MNVKLVLTAALLVGLLALGAPAYCFWLMSVPLSYKWVPVVITGFLLALFLFIISLITSLVGLVWLRRAPRPADDSQTRPIYPTAQAPMSHA